MCYVRLGAQELLVPPCSALFAVGLPLCPAWKQHPRATLLSDPPTTLWEGLGSSNQPGAHLRGLLLLCMFGFCGPVGGKLSTLMRLPPTLSPGDPYGLTFLCGKVHCLPCTGLLVRLYHLKRLFFGAAGAENYLFLILPGVLESGGGVNPLYELWAG